MTIRHYETVYITKTGISQTDQQAIVDRIKGIMSSYDGRILKYTTWGTRRLAYRIAKQNDGVYFHFVYLGNQNIVKEIERNFRMIDGVIRYLTVKLEDDVDVEAFATESDAPDLAKAQERQETSYGHGGERGEGRGDYYRGEGRRERPYRGDSRHDSEENLEERGDEGGEANEEEGGEEEEQN